MPRSRKKNPIVDTGEPRDFQFAGRIQWVNSNEIPVLYADQLWVQYSQGQFILTFGNTEIPAGRMTAKEQEILDEKGLDVTTTARVAVSPQRLEAMIRALAGVYEKYGNPAQSVKS